jgi:hypothetical protein
MGVIVFVDVNRANDVRHSDLMGVTVKRVTAAWTACAVNQTLLTHVFEDLL